MIDISLEEATERIKGIDERKLEDRAKRLTKLGAYTISLVDRPVPNLMNEYLREANFSYIYGYFRSCIFACATAVDQIFRHEIIQQSQAPEKKLEEIERKNLTFGPIIGKAVEEETPSLKPIISKAKWINKARNDVAVHPLCLTSEELDAKLANKLKIEYIKTVLSLLNEKGKEKILNISMESPDKKRVTIKEIIENPDKIKSRASQLLMWDIQNRIVQPIAFKVYRKTVEILLHLFSAK